MKKYIFTLIAACLILNSCSSANRIFINQDSFKKKTTIKLNQSLNGYSDESRRGICNLPDYYISFKHYFAILENQKIDYYLDVKLSTKVRAYEVEPTLYLSIDGIISELGALSHVTKMYQQGGSSSSSETSTTVSDDPDNEGEEIVETSTTYTTTSSHDTYQLMQLRFTPDIALLKQISKAEKVNYRLYIDNEVIDIPLKKRKRRKFEKYVEKLNEFV